MKQELRVSIIGHSVLVEGIAIQLEEYPQINIQRIHSEKNDFSFLLAGFKPHVIIFQPGDMGAEAILFHCQFLSSVRLVGLYIKSDRVLILDRHQLDSLSMVDLLHLITQDCPTSDFGNQLLQGQKLMQLAD